MPLRVRDLSCEVGVQLTLAKDRSKTLWCFNKQSETRGIAYIALIACFPVSLDCSNRSMWTYESARATLKDFRVLNSVHQPFFSYHALDTRDTRDTRDTSTSFREHIARG